MGLVTSGRALLKHFMRLYNAEPGYEEYQAEEDLKAFPNFTMGKDEADSKKHGYGLINCYERLPTTRLLEPPAKLKGQTRLLWRVGFPCAVSPLWCGVSPCGCVGAGPPSGSFVARCSCFHDITRCAFWRQCL